MKKTIYLVMLLFIFGCSPEPNPPRNDYPHIIYEQGTGTMTADNIIEYYNNVAICINGETIRPSFKLIIQPNKILVDGRLVRGATYIDESPIAVYLYHPYWQSEGVALSVLSHEFVHVILELLNQPRLANASHNLDGFECAF